VGRRDAASTYVLRPLKTYAGMSLNFRDRATSRSSGWHVGPSRQRYSGGPRFVEFRVR